jgi:hypothetical protein
MNATRLHRVQTRQLVASQSIASFMHAPKDVDDAGGGRLRRAAPSPSALPRRAQQGSIRSRDCGNSLIGFHSRGEVPPFAVVVTIGEAEMKRGDAVWDPAVRQSPGVTVAPACRAFGQALHWVGRSGWITESQRQLRNKDRVTRTAAGKVRLDHTRCRGANSRRETSR